MSIASKNTSASPLLLNGREVLITDTTLQLRDRPWWKSLTGVLGHIYTLAVGLFLMSVLWKFGYPLIVRLFLEMVLILAGILILLPLASVTTLVQIAGDDVLVRGRKFCARRALAFEHGFSLEGFTIFAVDTQRKRRRSVYGSLNPFLVRPMMETVSRFWSLETNPQPGDWPPPPTREGL